MRMEGQILVSYIVFSYSTTMLFSFQVTRQPLTLPHSYDDLLSLQGFDEYMNLVLGEAEEVHIKKKSRKPLGRILLKGDTITMIAAVPK